MSEEIDMLKIDQTTFRDLAQNQNVEINEAVKGATNHNHIKIKELENLMIVNKTEST